MSETGLPETEVITRKPRGDLGGVTLDEIEQRQEANSGPTPEEALAAAQEQIAARETEAAQLRERAMAAERAAEEARRTSAETQTARVGDQEVAISNAVEAGKSAKSAATAKLRAAREAGDFEAEVTAMDELTKASYRLEQAQDTKQRFDAWKANQSKAAPTSQTQTRQEQQQTQPTTEAQRWLDAHPRYNKDPEYQEDANASHRLAINSGCMEGSQAYIDYIENRMTRLYGENHGQIGAAPRGQAKPATTTQQRQPARAASSTAAPPSRGGQNIGMGAGIEYRHDGGVVRLVQGQDGKETVSGTIPADWVEAAKWSKMPVAAYAAEQLKVQSDIKNGSLGGLAYGESGTYK